jgi:hypothetical protein
MTLMTRGLVITATTRNDAPQRGQWPNVDAEHSA